MRDPAVFIHYVCDVDSAQLSDVERLATRSRIEGRAIQVSPQAIRARFNDTGPEFRQIAVVIIKAIGH